MLRGVAVLGILLINIQDFSMPVWENPVAYGDFSGLNRLAWYFTHLFAELKFITLFSMLYGAGIVLMAERAEARGADPAALHYRRTGWLLVFGLAHAYLIWSGDILVTYALCALVAYPFRRIPAGMLAGLGVFAIAVSTAIILAPLFLMDPAPPTAAQSNWLPDEREIQERIEAYRGSWLEQTPMRLSDALFLQTLVFAVLGAWRAGGCMLLGMALYKWRVITGEQSGRFYVLSAVVSAIAGFTLTGYGIDWRASAGWSSERALFGGYQWNYWGSLFTAFAYLALVALVCRRAWLPNARQALAAVGRTAFSNYIAQSLICTTLFYGHGLGWYGSVDRAPQLLIVTLVWALQLTVSPLWLRRFPYGPLEWLWRRLTYGRSPIVDSRSA